MSRPTLPQAIAYARKVAARRGRPQRLIKHGDQFLCGDMRPGEGHEGAELPEGYVAIVFPDGSVRM